MRLANKSIVWYPKKAWDDAGYEVPTTMQELTDLAAQIKADGITPWCMAWNADQATGWVGTDWIEQYVLTLNGPDVYNQWTSHEIPFDDPQIVAAFDEFGKIAKTDGEVYGGVKTVVNTQVAESMVPGVQQPARVHARAAGQLRDLVPAREDPGRPRQRGRGLRVPESRRRARRHRRSWVAPTSPRCSTATTTTPSRS